MAADDSLEYILTLKHTGIPGIVVSSVLSFVLLLNVLGTIGSITWRFPRLTVGQTRSLMSPNKRALLVSFMISLVLVDFISIHAWRAISGDGACVPPPDWFLLWSTGIILNSICLLVAWLHAPYVAVMIRTSVNSFTFLTLFYLFSCLARDQFCGSMFVVIPSLITGVINVFMVQRSLCLDVEEMETLQEVVGKTIARMTQGPVSHDKDSISVYMNVETDEESLRSPRQRAFPSDCVSVTLGTPRDVPMQTFKEPYTRRKQRKADRLEFLRRFISEEEEDERLRGEDVDWESSYFSEEEIQECEYGKRKGNP